ncbi:MAG TPA: hypothetical protein VGP21_03545 [Opitutaceae bacterium]|jgi:hypothetical protein|nr:hypothetical protein [Opitutaceae bacterium]
MSQLPPDKVTLEDLLRLKRAERPPAEFWAQFDRELQAKQLAALVGKKRWWHSAARTLTRFSYLPLGATAALAFAFMVTHQYLSPVAEIASSRKLPAPVAKTAPTPAVLRTEVAILSPSSTVAPQEKTISTTVASVSPADHPAASATTRQLPTTITWLADTLDETDTTPLSEHSMSVSFADERFASPRPASNLESMGEVKSHRTADPLTQVSSPTETQHARLLAALTDVRFVSTVDPVVLMHQHLATRMGDDGLADDAGRFDANGTSMSVKF